MTTLSQMAQLLRANNPANKPMRLQYMAQQWWPDAYFLKVRASNGGARIGARAAGGFAGRLVKRGLLRSIEQDGPRYYIWCEPS